MQKDTDRKVTTDKSARLFCDADKNVQHFCPGRLFSEMASLGRRTTDAQEEESCLGLLQDAQAPSEEASAARLLVPVDILPPRCRRLFSVRRKRSELNRGMRGAAPSPSTADISDFLRTPYGTISNARRSLGERLSIASRSQSHPGGSTNVSFTEQNLINRSLSWIQVG